jgi:poly(hydroxyalkanoate) depolymerase family esterase
LRKAGAFLRNLIGRPKRAHPLPEVEISATEAEVEEAPVVAPGTGRWIADAYMNFAGRRRYWLYVPSSYRGQSMPLVVMLHGCRQWPEDFAAGTGMNFLAEEQGFLVAYPSQPRSANGYKCWNWFNPRHQHRGRGEPSLIAGITRQIMDGYAIDPERVYVAGLSAGGSMTAILAATYPDLYSAAGVHSGLARGSARNVPSAYTAMQRGAAEIAPEALTAPMSLSRHRVPMIIFHGDLDDTVHPSNARHVAEQAWPQADTLLRHDRTQQRAKGGHSYTHTVYADSGRRAVLEVWEVHGSGHAWSGGNPAGSYTDAAGPDASREMLRFFLTHRLKTAKLQEEEAAL